jgi:hypothetical protein
MKSQHLTNRNPYYPTVKANLNYIDHMIGLSQGEDNLYYAVTDNGWEMDGWF